MLCDTCSRSMRSVRSAEGIVDERICQFGKGGREFGIVVCLALVEADIFEQSDFAFCQLGSAICCVLQAGSS